MSHINAMDEKEGEGVKVFRLKWPIILLEPPDHGSEEPSNGADKGAALVNGSLFLEDDNRLIGLSHGLPRLSERRSSCRDLRRLFLATGSFQTETSLRLLFPTWENMEGGDPP